MPSDATADSPVRRFVSAARGAVSRRGASMAGLGVLAGYSIAALGQNTVAVPVLGEASGLAVGTAGLAVSAVAYTRVGGCENCGAAGCGCSGDCGDSCSVDH
jgi:hypothetical protein